MTSFGLRFLKGLSAGFPLLCYLNTNTIPKLSSFSYFLFFWWMVFRSYLQSTNLTYLRRKKLWFQIVTIERMAVWNPPMALFLRFSLLNNVWGSSEFQTWMVHIFFLFSKIFSLEREQQLVHHFPFFFFSFCSLFLAFLISSTYRFSIPINLLFQFCFGLSIQTEIIRSKQELYPGIYNTVLYFILHQLIR